MTRTQLLLPKPASHTMPPDLWPLVAGNASSPSDRRKTGPRASERLRKTRTHNSPQATQTRSMQSRIHRETGPPGWVGGN